MTRRSRPVLAVAAALATAVVLLTAGCAGHGHSGTAAPQKSAPNSAQNAARESAVPSGYAEMRKKADAAESAAAAVDSDAAGDAGK
ncbi:hypothetical protein [Streptomyces sp. NPDC047000]|uniref:hypothetical protein n=1 Tax=Streptomyces sp. NPDC047000 TaxID=3155474 RepID=UPI00340506BC